MASPRVKLNVSGARFEFDRKLLDNRKFHRLTSMCEEAERKKMPLQFTVDRPSESFAAVLTFYQTGDLHMPTGVCPGYFKKELEYWGIDHDDLAECCLYRYLSFFDEVDTRQKFLQRTGDQAVVLPMYVPVTTGSKVSRFRKRLWSVVDYRENSTIAKVYFVILMTMVILSIVNIAFGTLPNFQRSLTQCELLQFLEHKGDDRLQVVREKFGNPDCHNDEDGSSVDEDEFDGWEYYDYGDYYYEYYYENENDTEADKIKHHPKKTLSLPHLAIRSLVFEIIDYVVVAFFTMDLVMRLWSCPSLPVYVTSVTNVIEMCAVAGSYTYIVVVHVERQHMYEQTWITVISFFQVFRALRLFRIVRNVRASKVLAYSLRQNVQDVPLLVVQMLVGISTFVMLYCLILQSFMYPDKSFSCGTARCSTFSKVFRALRLFRIVRNVRASKVLAYSLRQNVQDVSLLAILMLVVINTFAMLYYLILQVFRALRLFRIVRNVRASKVLAYSLRQNVQDVSLLVVLMLVGISTFAMLYYLIEGRDDVDSIPLAWYWTIITMTTVGYGDISPKTAGGRVLAAICACCGVLLLSVSLPLFVNNFLTLYQYSCIGDLLQREKETKAKLKGVIHAASLGSHLNADRTAKAEKLKNEGRINTICKEMTVESIHKDKKDLADAK